MGVLSERERKMWKRTTLSVPSLVLCDLREGERVISVELDKRCASPAHNPLFLPVVLLVFFPCGLHARHNGVLDTIHVIGSGTDLNTSSNV